MGGNERFGSNHQEHHFWVLDLHRRQKENSQNNYRIKIYDKGTGVGD